MKQLYQGKMAFLFLLLVALVYGTMSIDKHLA